MHQSNDQFIKSVENLQHNSSLIIENVHKRQNFIFSRHLMNVPPYKNYGSMANLLMNLHEQIGAVRLKEVEYDLFSLQEVTEELAEGEGEGEDATESMVDGGDLNGNDDLEQGQNRLNGGAFIENIEEEDEYSDG